MHGFLLKIQGFAWFWTLSSPVVFIFQQSSWICQSDSLRNSEEKPFVLTVKGLNNPTKLWLIDVLNTNRRRWGREINSPVQGPNQIEGCCLRESRRKWVRMRPWLLCEIFMLPLVSLVIENCWQSCSQCLGKRHFKRKLDSLNYFSPLRCHLALYQAHYRVCCKLYMVIWMFIINQGYIFCLFWYKLSSVL